MLVSLATWVVLFALYLLFAGQATGAELCAGALAAVTGVGVQVYLHQTGTRPMRLVTPWGRLAGRIGVSLARYDSRCRRTGPCDHGQGWCVA